MFATDILNNENTLTLSVCTKSSYDDQRKHDGFGHDVTSIGLGYPPIYKLPPPHYHLPTIYFKNFHSLPIIQLSSFLDPLTPIYKMGEGESNYDDIVQRGSKF